MSLLGFSLKPFFKRVVITPFLGVFTQAFFEKAWFRE